MDCTRLYISFMVPCKHQSGFTLVEQVVSTTSQWHASTKRKSEPKYHVDALWRHITLRHRRSVEAIKPTYARLHVQFKLKPTTRTSTRHARPIRVHSSPRLYRGHSEYCGTRSRTYGGTVVLLGLRNHESRVREGGMDLVDLERRVVC